MKAIIGLVRHWKELPVVEVQHSFHFQAIGLNNEHYEKQVFPAREVVSGWRMCDKHKSHLVVVFNQARGE